MPVSVKATFAAPVVVQPAAQPVADSGSAGSKPAFTQSADTVKNYRDYYRREDLRLALRAAILAQMYAKPQNFSLELVEDYGAKQAYANEFAKHMLDKLSTQSVKVLNETSETALATVYGNGGKYKGISGMYAFLYEGGVPQHRTEAEAAATAEVKVKFKGC